MSDVESRLRELRRATEGQLRPSPGLLDRIESARQPRTSWRWTPAIALAAVTLIALAVALLPAGQDDMEVASRPPTRAEYIEAMNQRCVEYIAETEQLQVLFPTPEAFTLAAENRITAISRTLDRIRFFGAPPDARDALEQVTREAGSAEASARAALAAAQVKDTASAAASLAEADAAIQRAGALLATYGADRCRPPGTP